MKENFSIPPVALYEVEEDLDKLFSDRGLKTRIAHRLNYRALSMLTKRLDPDDPQPHSLTEWLQFLRACREESEDLYLAVRAVEDKHLSRLSPPKNNRRSISDIYHLEVLFAEWKAAEASRDDGMITPEKLFQAKQRFMDAFAAYGMVSHEPAMM
jgi:hypothetical protein